MMEKIDMESGASWYWWQLETGSVYIGEQLDSILTRRCPGIRILVSDDCSQRPHAPDCGSL